MKARLSEVSEVFLHQRACTWRWGRRCVEWADWRYLFLKFNTLHLYSVCLYIYGMFLSLGRFSPPSIYLSCMRILSQAYSLTTVSSELFRLFELSFSLSRHSNFTINFVKRYLLITNVATTINITWKYIKVCTVRKIIYQRFSVCIWNFHFLFIP